MSGETSSSDIETKILEIAQNSTNGIKNSDIQSAFPNIPAIVWTKAINKFLKSGALELFQEKNELLYKFKDVTKKTVIDGADNEEMVVYKIIEQAGNRGIWIRTIRVSSNLNMTQLNKVLKNLETKKLIKVVKSVAESKKKVYMLYDLEPDTSVTGGAWYQDQDFESEFVDVLSQQCLRFLQQKSEEANKLGAGPLLSRNKSYVTANDVHKFISDLGISKVSLSVEDMESILYTIVLDNKAERVSNPNGSFLYRAINSFLPSMGLIKTTCGICPIANRCADTGLVTPKVCNYLTEWLNE